METSNQTEDTPTPYSEPPPHEDGAPVEEASWGWHPTPPLTRATVAVEHSESLEEAPYLEPQPPAPEQQYYSPRVQPLQPRQPTQPLQQSAPQPPHPPPRATQASSPATATPPRRRAILGEEPAKAEDLGLPSRATTSYMVSGMRHANQRRSTSLFKLLGLLFLVNLLIIGAFGAWLYNHFVGQVEARMADFSSRPLPSGSGSSSSTRAPLTTGGGATAVEIKQLQDEFDKRFSDLKAQLQAAQSRISETESTQQQQQTRVSALASQMATSAGDASTKTTGEAVATAVVPGVEAEIPPSENDLILLKERNRLTSYADEAIATGAREPYDRLWQALEDQRLIKLIHAARAEILRVQNFYLSGSRIESYTIQVGDYFPESASLKDSQLKDEQLIELLENKENPWQVRMKAANLLGLRRSRAVGDALVKAVKYDENLDVVKEATFSFEQMTGFRARIFEPASMDAWWIQYNAAPGSATRTAAATAPASSKSSSKKNSTPPAAVPVAPPPSSKEMQPELRLPEWDEEQEARERADKAVAEQQKAKDKKMTEKQAEAKDAGAAKAPKKKSE